VFERLVVWSAASGVLWLAGAALDGDQRLLLWLPALAVELTAPAVRYWLPGRGRAATADWDVEGAHFAERCQVFIIIALGESIVVTGATAAAAGLTSTVVLCLVVAFVETAALWWLYFGAAAEEARGVIRTCEDPGRLARDAYTYFHLPIVAGIIATAVANDLLIGAPHAAPSGVGVAMILGGPALYLLGETLFGWRVTGGANAKRLAVAALLIVLVPLGGQISTLLLSLIVVSLLGALAVWERSDETSRRPRPAGRAGRPAARLGRRRSMIAGIPRHARSAGRAPRGLEPVEDRVATPSGDPSGALVVTTVQRLKASCTRSSSRAQAAPRCGEALGEATASGGAGRIARSGSLARARSGRPTRRGGRRRTPRDPVPRRARTRRPSRSPGDPRQQMRPLQHLDLGDDVVVCSARRSSGRIDAGIRWSTLAGDGQQRGALLVVVVDPGVVLAGMECEVSPRSRRARTIRWRGRFLGRLSARCVQERRQVVAELADECALVPCVV
jgi:hypothetical protein